MGMLKKIIGMPDGNDVEANFEDEQEAEAFEKKHHTVLQDYWDYLDAQEQAKEAEEAEEQADAQDEKGGEDNVNEDTEQAAQEEQTPQPPDYESIIAEALRHEDGAFYEAFSKAVRAEVEKRVGGMAPKADAESDDARQLIKFRKMGYKERLELLRADPATYQKLTKLDKE